MTIHVRSFLHHHQHLAAANAIVQFNGVGAGGTRDESVHPVGGAMAGSCDLFAKHVPDDHVQLRLHTAKVDGQITSCGGRVEPNIRQAGSDGNGRGDRTKTLYLHRGVPIRVGAITQLTIRVLPNGANRTQVGEKE